VARLHRRIVGPVLREEVVIARHLNRRGEYSGDRCPSIHQSNNVK
jgi:hypothetical protein